MEQNKEQIVQQEEGLSLVDFIHMCRNHIISIVAFCVTFMAAAIVYSAVIQKPTYTATASAMIQTNLGETTTTTSDISIARSLSSTYEYFMESDFVLETIIDANTNSLSKTYTITDVQEIMTFSIYEDDSLVIVLTVTSNNANDSVLLVNGILNTSKALIEDPENGYTMLSSKASLAIIDSPTAAVEDSRNTARNAIIGLFGGAVLALIYVFLFESLNTTFKDAKAIERELGVPVFASIPEYDFDKELK